MHPVFRGRGRNSGDAHHLRHQIVAERDHRCARSAVAAVRRGRCIQGQAGSVPAAARSRRRHRWRPVRPGGRGREVARPVPRRPAAGTAAARRLPLCQRAARCAPRGARLCARQLSLSALPQGGAAGREVAAVQRARRRRVEPHGRGRSACARPDQHSGERHGAGGARRCRACARGAVRRKILLHRRRRAAGEELSAHSRRRQGLEPCAAADRLQLGRGVAPEGDAGRQGRLLRHRRRRPEAVERHADHEEGHGRRGQRAGARADDHGCEAEACGCAC